MLNMKTLFTSLVLLFMANQLNAATSALPRTGQTDCFDTLGRLIACAGTGQDGAIQKGAKWATPRFTDNANGTVTDNFTGLIWLKRARCFDSQIWTAAMNSANTLASGSCGLTDGSTSGQWRLPNRKELKSLVDHSRHEPALPSGHPFTSVSGEQFWTSSTKISEADSVWTVEMSNGGVGTGLKSIYYPYGYAWPVRSR